MPFPRKENLLIAFDAFGTLFSPRAPIAVQYVETAKKFGITGLKPDLLKTAFRKGTSPIYPLQRQQVLTSFQIRIQGRKIRAP
jgi:hypothetical protein